MRRQLYMGGGVARQGYGLGSLVRKAGNVVKQVFKSPIGQAALLYGLGGGTFFGKGLPGLARGAAGTTGFQMGNIMPNVMNYMVGQKSIPNIGAKATKGLIGAGGKFSLGKSAIAGSLALAAIPDPTGTAGFNMAQRKGEVEGFLRRYYKNYYKNNWQEGWNQDEEDEFVNKYTSEYNQGGRVGLYGGGEAGGSLDAGAQSIVKTGNMETEDSDRAQNILTAKYEPGNFTSQEITRLYRILGAQGGSNTLFKRLHKILKNPGMFPEAENEMRTLLDNYATGGRVGLYAGTDPEDYPEQEDDVTPWELQQEEGVPIGPMAGMGGIMKLFETPYGFDRDRFESMMLEWNASDKSLGLHDFALQFLDMVKRDTPDAPVQTAAQGGRIGALGGGVMGGRVGLKVLRDLFDEDDEEEAAQGGRIGYAGGGITHLDGRIGFFTGMREQEQRAKGPAGGGGDRQDRQRAAREAEQASQRAAAQKTAALQALRGPIGQPAPYVAPLAGGGPDWINTHEPELLGNPAVVKEIEDAKEFRIANQGIEDVADYSLKYTKPPMLGDTGGSMDYMLPTKPPMLGDTGGSMDSLLPPPVIKTVPDDGILKNIPVVANPNLNFGVNIGKGLNPKDLARLFNNYYKLSSVDEEDPDRWDYGYGPTTGITGIDVTPEEIVEEDKGLLEKIRNIYIKRYGTLDEYKNKGGRVGAFGGGVMGIGTPGMRLPGIPQMAPDGLEYNMKAGGFQNLGAQEGKDDVNAKLAKNEFVMTADAVRGAGGGNIEVGAQRMYDTMKQLEGKVA